MLIPIQCSKMCLTTLNDLKEMKILGKSLKKIKWKSGEKAQNHLTVRYSSVVFHFTEDPTLSDDNIVLKLPERFSQLPNQHSTPYFSSFIRLPHVENGPLLTSKLKFRPGHGGLISRSFRTRPETEKSDNIVLSNIFKKLSGKDKAAVEEQKIKIMLQDPSTTEEEKDKIKLAFAEGYLKSNSVTPSKTLERLKLLQQLLSILVIWILIMMIARSSILEIGHSNAIDPETINVSFKDVKGVNEAKQELEEIVEFLRNPDKFIRVGGKLPKGVLLVGPPGTGKTLLARALAGEAGVPFFHACGAEFDEMLVGQGARRVRDLFKTAKEQAPCVIFIDEIDAVGSKRTNTLLHPYANQTVNQLLTEMDGFNTNAGVIVVGATNRREDLDPALLRPGRFDVEVMVYAPDYLGRKDLFELYLGAVKQSDDVDLDVLARGTVGFTGADIENIVNQAAIRASASGALSVSMQNLEEARDKALMGPEIRSRARDEEANKMTAYHEAGHALVAFYTKYSQPLHKVTIVARGSSLGHTAYIPHKDRYHVTKADLLAQIDTMMGGRAAEELIFGAENITSGAASDLQSATQLATRMVKDWGMSDKAGLRTYRSKSDHDGDDLGQTTRNMIDSEINAVVTESYERAKKLLLAHAKEHKILAEALIKYETLDREQVQKLLAS